MNSFDYVASIGLVLTALGAGGLMWLLTRLPN